MSVDEGRLSKRGTPRQRCTLVHCLGWKGRKDGRYLSLASNPSSRARAAAWVRLLTFNLP